MDTTNKELDATNILSEIDGSHANLNTVHTVLLNVKTFINEQQEENEKLRLEVARKGDMSAELKRAFLKIQGLQVEKTAMDAKILELTNTIEIKDDKILECENHIK